MSLELAPGQRAASVSVRNAGRETIVVQVQPQRWTREAGDDRYADDPTILATPPLMRLAPDAEQIVRIGFPAGAPAAAAQERAYRVWFREVAAPDPVPAGDAGVPGQVRMMLNVGVPLFVAPARAQRAAQWSAVAVDGGLRLRLANRGNVRLRLTGLRVRPAGGGEPLADVRELIYVFPGETRELQLRLAAPLAPGTELTLAADSEEGALSTRLQVARE